MDDHFALGALNAHIHSLDAAAQAQWYDEVAQAALRHYALQAPHPVFLQHNAGITYRVETPELAERFLLKIHAPVGSGSQPPLDVVEAQMRWLSWLDHQAALAVQAPLPNRAGALVTWLADPAIPEPVVCTLQRWLEGELVNGDFTLAQLERVGAMMATLHRVGGHSPEALTDALPQFDATALTDWTSKLGAAVPLGLLSPGDGELIAQACEHLRRWLSDSAGQAGRWGPIHGDLHHANILLDGDAVHPIDFDGVVVAPYALDLGTMLYHIHYQGAAAQRALINGYQRVCPLPVADHNWLDAALVCSALANLAFQVTIPEQRASPILLRNLRQLVDDFCRSLVTGTPILAR